MTASKDWIAFAAEWCDAWDAHDIERVLAHFHDDAIFTSPAAAKLIPETNGNLIAKNVIRAYWTKALTQIPDLRFDVLQVFGGIETVVILYRNQKGVSVSEVLIFQGGRVAYGHGTYPVGIDNPVGARS